MMIEKNGGYVIFELFLRQISFRIKEPRFFFFFFFVENFYIELNNNCNRD